MFIYCTVVCNYCQCTQENVNLKKFDIETMPFVHACYKFFTLIALLELVCFFFVLFAIATARTMLMQHHMTVEHSTTW
jgi:hypothetical protein